MRGTLGFPHQAFPACSASPAWDGCAAYTSSRAMSAPTEKYQLFTSPPEERLDAYYRRMTEPKPLRARSKQEWIQRRGFVREQTFRALGLSPIPDRLPLEVRVGGSLDRDGYTVERVYWQTWPKV